MYKTIAKKLIKAGHKDLAKEVLSLTEVHAEDALWEFMSPEDRKEMGRLFKRACKVPSGSPLFLAIDYKMDELWKKYGRKPTMTDKEIKRLKQYEKEGMKLKV